MMAAVAAIRMTGRVGLRQVRSSGIPSVASGGSSRSLLTLVPRTLGNATPTWRVPAAVGVRHMADKAKQEGTVKMWNEEKGFGFISPNSGGDDVFCHRSALGEGVVLTSGATVTYEAEWDERKRKERAVGVTVNSGGAPAGGRSAGMAPQQSSTPGAKPTSHNMVAAGAQWAISKQPMAADGDKVRHRITVRSDAPKGSAPDSKKEEFQIVGNASWNMRIYPAGPDKEETVVLRPGGDGSRAANDRGKGHGRNWAVEGAPGTVFDILYDPESMMVSCQNGFSEN